MLNLPCVALVNLLSLMKYFLTLFFLFFVSLLRSPSQRRHWGECLAFLALSQFFAKEKKPKVLTEFQLLIFEILIFTVVKWNNFAVY